MPSPNRPRRASSKSPNDRPCKYNSGSRSPTSFVRRAKAAEYGFQIALPTLALGDASPGSCRRSDPVCEAFHIRCDTQVRHPHPHGAGRDTDPERPSPLLQELAVNAFVSHFVLTLQGHPKQAWTKTGYFAYISPQWLSFLLERHPALVVGKLLTTNKEDRTTLIFFPYLFRIPRREGKQ